MSIQAQLEAGLAAKGEFQIQARTNKYRVYTTKFLGAFKDGLPRYFYLGRAGALRIGRSATDSVPCSERLRQAILQAPLEVL